MGEQLYEMVVNSQFGPHELSVRHLEDGTITVWLPNMSEPMIVRKGNAIRVSVYVPGPPVPVTLKAWFAQYQD